MQSQMQERSLAAFWNACRNGNLFRVACTGPIHQGPDLQRILCQTYDSVGLTPALLRAYELQSIYKKIISWTYEKLAQNFEKISWKTYQTHKILCIGPQTSVAE